MEPNDPDFAELHQLLDMLEKLARSPTPLRRRNAKRMPLTADIIAFPQRTFRPHPE